MRSCDCEASNDDVTFSYDFLNCHVPIGERHKGIADDPLYSCPTDNAAEIGHVLGVITQIAWDISGVSAGYLSSDGCLVALLEIASRADSGLRNRRAQYGTAKPENGNKFTPSKDHAHESTIPWRKAQAKASSTVSFGSKADVASTRGLSDSSLMWRTLLSVFLSAILGSAVATLVYLAWQGAVPATSEDGLGRMFLVVWLAASCFTIPGSIVLAGMELGLSKSVRPEQALDGTLLAIGALAGAAVLGGLARDAELALVGAFYGFTTALLFVVFQRQLGSRRERLL